MAHLTSLILQVLSKLLLRLPPVPGGYLSSNEKSLFTSHAEFQLLVAVEQFSRIGEAVFGIAARFSSSLGMRSRMGTGFSLRMMSMRESMGRDWCNAENRDG